MLPQAQEDFPSSSSPGAESRIMEDEDLADLYAGSCYGTLELDNFLNQAEPGSHVIAVDPQEDWSHPIVANSFDTQAPPPTMVTQYHYQPVEGPAGQYIVPQASDVHGAMGTWMSEVDDDMAMTGNQGLGYANLQPPPSISTMDYDLSEGMSSNAEPWTPYRIQGPVLIPDVEHFDIPYSPNSGNSIGGPSRDQNTGSNIAESPSPITSNGAYPPEMYLSTNFPPSSPNGRGSGPGGSASPASTSMTTSSARTVECSVDNCDATFSGTYAKGNLARHMRLKHGHGEKIFSCGINGCHREYKRKDALLKHQRKVHPELEKAPAIPRLSSRT